MTTLRPEWRTGSKVPLNVYEGDRPVCQCHTAEDAMRIARSVNAMDVLKQIMHWEDTTRWLEPIPSELVDQARAAIQGANAGSSAMNDSGEER